MSHMVPQTQLGGGSGGPGTLGTLKANSMLILVLQLLAAGVVQPGSHFVDFGSGLGRYGLPVPPQSVDGRQPATALAAIAASPPAQHHTLNTALHCGTVILCCRAFSIFGIMLNSKLTGVEFDQAKHDLAQNIFKGPDGHGHPFIKAFLPAMIGSLNLFCNAIPADWEQVSAASLGVGAPRPGRGGA